MKQHIKRYILDSIATKYINKTFLFNRQKMCSITVKFPWLNIEENIPYTLTQVC